MSIALTNCLLPTKNMCLELQILIFITDFSISLSQSAALSFVVPIGTPRYLNGNLPCLKILLFIVFDY